MNPWWFSSSLMGTASCSLREREREDSHPAQGQDRTAPPHQLRHALLQGDCQDAKKKERETRETEAQPAQPHTPHHEQSPLLTGQVQGCRSKRGASVGFA